MRRSTGRILTTHVGSLPRPASLLDLMKTGERGHELDSAVTQAVDAAVRQQIAHDVDVVTDAEQGKGSFFGYVAERLTGFEPRPGARAELWSAFVLRTDVMHSFRQFPLLDPKLPDEFMDQPMLRGQAVRLFHELWDGLSGQARRHVAHLTSGAVPERVGWLTGAVT